MLCMGAASTPKSRNGCGDGDRSGGGARGSYGWFVSDLGMGAPRSSLYWGRYEVACGLAVGCTS